MLIENKELHRSAVVTKKNIFIYDVIVPESLVKDIKISKKDILLYHTEPIKTINIRKQPTDDRVIKEIKKTLKGKQ